MHATCLLVIKSMRCTNGSVCHPTCLQPVIALMVPRLIQTGHKWQLYGLSAARQLQIVRGEHLQRRPCSAKSGRSDSHGTLGTPYVCVAIMSCLQ